MLPAILLSLALQNTPPPKVTEIRITKASKQFDFVLHVTPERDDNDRNVDDGSVAGPGWVAVYRKGQRLPVQTISMDSIELTLQEDGEAMVNKTLLYDEQSALNTGDFNFDGHEDFAVQDGHNGSYGMPSYSVFLFDAHAGKFILNDPLSTLTEQTLGFFQIDKVHRQLVTWAKSGCCYHEEARYNMVRDRPVAVFHLIEDATKSQKYVYVTRKRRVAGKWQSSTRRYLQSQYYK